MGRARPTGETREAPAGTRWPQRCHTPATSPTASHWSVRRAEGSAGAGPGDGQLLEAVAVMPPALCSVSVSEKCPTAPPRVAPGDKARQPQLR